MESRNQQIEELTEELTEEEVRQALEELISKNPGLGDDLILHLGNVAPETVSSVQKILGSKEDDTPPAIESEYLVAGEKRKRTVEETSSPEKTPKFEESPIAPTNPYSNWNPELRNPIELSLGDKLREKETKSSNYFLDKYKQEQSALRMNSILKTVSPVVNPDESGNKIFARQLAYGKKLGGE